ncbi:hypothetical protein GCM10023334_070820 [Nonomuraea thailandensis]
MRLVGIELITGGRPPARGIGRTSPARGLTPGGPAASGVFLPGVAVTGAEGPGEGLEAVPAGAQAASARTHATPIIRCPLNMGHHLASLCEVLPLSTRPPLPRVAA